MKPSFIIWIFLMNCCLFFQTQGQDQPEIVVTSGHISNVYCINFSPNSRFVVTGGMDKTVRIWDRSLAQEFRVLYGHTHSIWKAVYTSDNKHIISVDEQGTLIVWSHATGEIVNRIKLDMYTRQFTYIPNTNNILVKKGGEMIELDVMKNQQVRTHGTLVDTEIRLMKDGEHLITRLEAKINGLAIYNYKTQQNDGELIANHDKPLLSVALSKNGQYVAAYSIVNKSVNIWEVKTKKVIASFNTPDQNVLKMLFTPNSKELLVIDRAGKILVYSTQKGKLKRTVNKGSSNDVAAMQRGAYKVCTAWDVAISPDNAMIAIVGMVNESKGGGMLPNTFMGALLFDFKRSEEIGRLEGYFKMPSHLSVSKNGKYLINSTYNRHSGLRIWNMKEGALERFIATSGVAGSSADGSAFAAWVIGDKDAEGPVLTVFNSKTLKPIFKTTKVEALNDIVLNADGSVMVTQEVDIDLKNPMNNRFFFRVWDVPNKKQLGKEIEFSMKETGTPMYKGVKISPDGKHLVAQTNNLKVVSWEIATGNVVAEAPSQLAYEFLLDFVPNSTKILLSKTKPEYNMEQRKMEADMTWYEWDYVTGEASEPFNLGKEGVLFSGDFSDDGAYFVTGQGGYFNEVEFNVVIWDWATKTPVCTMEGHHGAIKFVWFGAKGKRVYSVGEDGFIKVWEIEDCALAGSLIAQSELDYIILSPDNYYKASKGNNEGIGFRYNSNLYTFDQFDIRFNRPDKVLTSLGVSKYSVKLYTKAWEKRIQKMGFVPTEMDGELALPSIELVDKTSLPVTTEQRNLKLNVKAWDDVHNLDRIAVYVNDVPSPALKGISLKGDKTKSIEQQLDIDLSKGKNLVKVSVFNEQGLESLRESFQISYAPTSEKKPDLYIYTIGVSEFKEEERNLKFATKDAEDLVGKFKASGYFANVHSEMVFNEKATKENIAKTSKFLNKAHTDDQVIIYISSHGLLDDELNYYLAMHDVDFENPSARGLPYDAINNMLDGMACRNRLIMIDACHSGEVDKDEAVTRSSIAATNSKVNINHKSGSTMIRPKAGLKNSFTYMKTLFNDVSKGTGATVISAAGGYEFALESDDWNNGVFTYAILQGLTSGDADANGDGWVYVSELKNYVTAQVVELTDGKQHPTTRSENALNDCILFKTKSRYKPMIDVDKE